MIENDDAERKDRQNKARIRTILAQDRRLWKQLVQRYGQGGPCQEKFTNDNLKNLARFRKPVLEDDFMRCYKCDKKNGTWRKVCVKCGANLRPPGLISLL